LDCVYLDIILLLSIWYCATCWPIY